jgi:hypothetical protein
MTGETAKLGIRGIKERLAAIENANRVADVVAWATGPARTDLAWLIGEYEREDGVLCDIAEMANWSPSQRPSVDEIIIMASNALTEAQDD